MSDKNLEQLVEVLQAGLLVNSKDGWKRVRLGETYQKLGRIEEATSTFRRAIRDQPEYAPAHAALGTLLAEQGNWPDVAMKSRRFEEAAQFLARAREQTPNDPDVLLAPKHARISGRSSVSAITPSGGG